MALTRKKQTERLINQVIGVLAQRFHDGKYDEGWNDRRVAMETKTSKIFVAETRQFRLAPVTVGASGSPIGGALSREEAPAPEVTAE